MNWTDPVQDKNGKWLCTKCSKLAVTQFAMVGDDGQEHPVMACADHTPVTP